MSRISRVELQYYTLNLTVLPPNSNPQIYYSQLIKRLFENQIKVEYGAFFYRLTKLDSIGNDEAFYGVISKYVSLDDLEWVEGVSDEPVDYNVPDDVRGRKATYEFVFYPASHKFAFIKKGRIDQEVQRRGAPLKSIIHILKLAFDLILESENKSSEINIVQSDQIFEQIFSNVVKSLDLTVSYSNPGLADDHEQIMDDYLRDANIGKARVTMQPDSTGEIDTDATFTRGLIDLARENGRVRARIETDEGERTINTEDHPEVTSVTVERSGNIELKFIQKIIEKLRRVSNG